ncbi:hypothetical protein CQA53_01335 [Helicobacter didelphidarum]|uniref:Phosphatidic acid phosphatase type 2/haloperoxidase domain-containing protein n=1 Tax=Helicobacter didelphidarum TaxID=2040648 RepID=A0A3D8ISW0_9HELI|nr:phosphatase PAP2 family protein [Helicobacter didelphidarum]RDU67671.1 hypothetical protein CQA53_01335 [Helicobacter didelphidarum]
MKSQDSYINEVWHIVIIMGIILIALFIWQYDIKLYGDIFRFLPLYLGFFLLYQRQYKRIIILLIGVCIVVGVTFSMKFSFSFLANHYGGGYITIAQRPINGKFNGFPSGHTAPAFFALGFVINYYSKKWIFLVFALAILIPFSRIFTLWHTPLQVIVGALLGIILGFFITRWLKNFEFLKDNSKK